jgi:hypothetical protein
MAGIDDWKSPLFVEAVLLWTGWGREIMPRRDEGALERHFGTKTASDLLPLLKHVEDEFYATDANYRAATLPEMGKMAIADFKRKHPDAPDDIAEALAWCYTFDFK